MAFALERSGPDGTTNYLADTEPPRPTTDPFDARPFPDRRAIDEFFAEYPECNRTDVRIVPWPVDLDVAYRPGPEVAVTPIQASSTTPKPTQDRKTKVRNDAARKTETKEPMLWD